MGFPKRDLWFDGQTFLRRVVELVSQVCWPVICVGAFDERDRSALAQHSGLPDNTIFCHDATPDLGPLESIRVGLATAQPLAAHAFVTSCDVPNLQPALVHALAQQIDSHEAVMPIRGERIYGMTAIYKAILHERIADMMAQPDCQRRVSDIRSIANTKTISLDELKIADPKLESFTNVNTVEQYLRRLKESGLVCPAELLAKLGPS